MFMSYETFDLVLNDTTVLNQQSTRKAFISESEDKINSDYIELLNYNTKNNVPGNENWHHIYNVAHQIVLLEVESLNSEKRADAKTRLPDIAINFLKHILSLSLSYLNTRKIVKSVCRVLYNVKYKRIRPTYLLVLLEQVFQNENHLRNITLSEWQSLLEKCWDAFQEEEKDFHKIDYIYSLQCIIKYGCLYTKLITDVVKQLPFLVKLIKNAHEQSDVFIKGIFQLTLIVCQSLILENRMELCKFGEMILPNLMTMSYYKTKDGDTYDLFLIFVRTHHPRAVHSYQDAVQTFDERNWRQILNDMRAMLFEKCKYDDSESLIKLSCEVFTITSNGFEVAKDPNFIPTAMNNLQMFSNLATNSVLEGREENCAYFPVLIEVLKKYPGCLRREDFIPILTEATKILRLPFNVKKFSYFIRLIIILMDLEKDKFPNGGCDKAQEHWRQIWDEWPRILIEINKFPDHRKIEYYELLHRFIINSNLYDASKFLTHYQAEITEWSPLTVSALLLFCQHFPLRILENTTEPISQEVEMFGIYWELTNWSLFVPWDRIDHNFPIKDLSELLICLAVQSFCQRPNNDPLFLEKMERSYFKSNLEEDIEKFYISLLTPFNCEDVEQKKVEKKHRLPFDIRNRKKLDGLIATMLKLITDKDDLKTLIFKTALLIKFTSDLLDHKVIDNEMRYQLLRKIQASLKSINQHMQNVSFKRLIKNFSNVAKGIKFYAKNLRLIFDAASSKEVAETVIDEIPKTFIQSMHDLLNLDIKLENDRVQARSAIVQLELAFGSLETEREITELQNKCIKDNLNVEKFDLTRYFSVIEIICEFILEKNEQFLGREIIEDFVSLCIAVYNHSYKDFNVVHWLLNIIPELYLKTENVRGNTTKVLQLLFTIHEKIEATLYGLQTHLLFAKTLYNVLKIDPTLILLSSDNFQTENKLSFEALILEQYRSPHYCIRIQMAEVLRLILGSEKISYTWKLLFFDQLKSIVLYLLQVSNEKVSVERVPWIASATCIISKTIIHGSFFRNQAVNILLSLQVENKVNERCILKILDANSREKSGYLLIEKRIRYFLLEWLSKPTNSLSNFPFLILSCTSEIDFYKTYLKDVFSIVLMKSTLEESVQFCRSINLRFPQALLNCFVEIFPWLITQKETNHAAMQIYENALGSQADDNLRNSLMANVGNVMLKITEKLHDAEDFEAVFKIEMTAPIEDNLQLNVTQWMKCLSQFIKLTLKVNQELDEFLYLKVPGDLVKILTSLPKRLYSSTQIYIEEKLKYLYQYVSFSYRLSLTIEKPQFNEMSSFVIQMTCFDLLNIIEDESLCVAECACRYLDLFLQLAVQKKPNIINKLYSHIVQSLVRLAERQTKNNDAIKTLRYLIINEEKTFQNQIAKLVPFPKDEKFSVFKSIHDKWKDESNLESEMLLFIEQTNDTFKKDSIKAVRHLKDSIKDRKRELSILQKKVERRDGFSKIKPNLVELVIVRIIKMLRNTSSIELQFACVECLDTIGPFKFSTRSIYTDDIAISSNGFPTLTCNLIVFLTQLLSSNRFELRESVITALKSICLSDLATHIFQPDFLELLNEENIVLQSELPTQFLYPFLHNNEQSVDSRKAHIILNMAKVKEIFSEENAIWTSDTKENYKEWILNLTCEIAKCVNQFEDMSSLFRSDLHFCEQFFPEIIHSLLNSNEHLLSIICHGLNTFLIHHFGENCTPKCHPRVVEMIIKCIDYVKMHVPPSEILPIDLLAIIRSTKFISSHIRGLYYAELAYNQLLKEQWKMFENGQIFRQKELDMLDPKIGVKLQMLVRDHCINIGDIDMIHGCRLMFDNEPESLKKYYTDVRHWEKVIPLQDVNLKYDSESLKDMVYSLQQNGLDWIAQTVASWSDKSTEDWQYELAWQLTDWSKLEQHQTNKFKTSESSFEYMYLKALRKFSCNFVDEMKECSKEAKSLVITDLYNQSIDNSRIIYPKMCQLQMLREMEDFSDAQKCNNYEDLLADWKLFDTTKGCEFHDLKNILLQRRLLCILSDTSKDLRLKDEIHNTYIMLSNIAREQGFKNKAVQELDIAAINSNLSKEQNYLLQFEQALAASARNETEVAIQKFRNLTLEEDIDPNLKAKALIAYGDKVTEQKSQNPMDITSIYSEAYEILKSQTSYDYIMKAQIIMAKYADARYQDLLDYTSSSEYMAFRKLVEESKLEVRPKNIKDNDTRKKVFILNKQYEEECKHIDAVDKNQNSYMMSALNHYLDVLEKTDAFDMYLARVIAIWFKHKNNVNINNLLNQRLSLIPSYKFVPLMRQIAPNLRCDKSLFSTNIRNVVKRATLDHPYHCVPTLLLLQNYQLDADEDDDSLKVATKPKVYAAQEMIKQLLNTDIKRILTESDAIAKALISVAYLEIDKGIRQQKLPHNHEIFKIKDYKFASVPTASVELRKDTNYSHGIIGVQYYLPKIRLAGGVNQPKVLTCVGTDGKEREELVKGKDDMRQDAIMQQLFKEVNLILNNNTETQKRNLYLRTYKIVPLTQKSGVVEWCQNSKPMISILLGPDNVSGLHKKYFPNDETSMNCKMKMKRVSKSSKEEKLQVYLECCSVIHPAFQYFFLEQFPSPQLWFEHRLIYTKSVAASSIVGYIVGLGDRHFNNILLDVKTCEVIHIDFGIAFEQGRVLSIPETVPFRLTRDMEAGMGTLAIDGVLRRCCEVTYEALREKHDIIIMLLRVLLYDPLFQWLITEEVIVETPQTSFSSSKTISDYNASNQSAQRALVRVQQRLQGLDRGTILSIPVQITKLLQEARDPKNLCLLYEGWQPFL